jgi:predicted dehydrogenase
MDKIRTAVVGAGKMGSIHSRVYHQLEQSVFLGVMDIDEKAAQKLAKEYKVQAFQKAEDLLGKVDAVTISTPTVTHLELARLFLENGISVLIEKPLAANSQQGRSIVELAKKNHLVAAVGHSERCNPVVQAIKRLEIEPKFIEATRISPFPFRSTDVGVVLDVMIHDIDIILSLARSPVKKVDAVGVNVLADQEDICNARITFENGCIANITASRVAFKTERKVRVFSRQAYLSLDYQNKTGTVIKAKPNIDIPRKVKEILNSNKPDILKMANWLQLVHREELKIDDREPLRVEQEAFLHAVADKTATPEVSAEEGLAAMECAEMILKSISENKWE